MDQFSIKVKRIFIPFLVIALATIAICAFLHWWLFIKNSAFSINDDVLNILIPLLLPGIPILIWLRPRLRLLNLKSNGKDAFVGFILLSWIIVAIPNAIAQTYVITATGKLTNLGNIDEIKNTAPTKYYTVKHFYLNKRLAHVRTIFSVSGKHNTYFDMAIYVAIPVFSHVFPDTNMIAAIRNRANPKVLIIVNGKSDTMYYLKRLPADSISMMRFINPSLVMPQYGEAGKYGALAVVTRGYKKTWQSPPEKIWPVAWLGITYYKSISNNLNKDQKQQRYKNFLAQSDTVFKKMAFDKFIYLDRVSRKRNLNYYQDAIRFPGDVEDTNPIILNPVFRPYSERNGESLLWVFSSLGVGSFIFLLMLAAKRLQRNVINSEG